MARQEAVGCTCRPRPPGLSLSSPQHNSHVVLAWQRNQNLLLLYEYAIQASQKEERVFTNNASMRHYPMQVPSHAIVTKLLPSPHWAPACQYLSLIVQFCPAIHLLHQYQSFSRATSSPACLPSSRVEDQSTARRHPRWCRRGRKILFFLG